MAGKWEFPGGKIDTDEVPQTALLRELSEELGMNVIVDSQICTVYHRYPEFKLQLTAFKCNFLNATYILTDHDEIQWIDPKDLLKYDLCEADIPIAKLLYE